jgi:hypothetical protein
MSLIKRSWRKQLPVFVIILASPLILAFNVVTILLNLFSPRTWRFDKADAKKALTKELSQYKEMSYQDLTKLFVTEKFIDAKEVISPAGAELQVEIEGFWDDTVDGNLRIFGSIDDGGLRAYCPLSESFIMRPDGSLLE